MHTQQKTDTKKNKQRRTCLVPITMHNKINKLEDQNTIQGVGCKKLETTGAGHAKKNWRRNQKQTKNRHNPRVGCRSWKSDDQAL
jgi:hypothetical protein